MIDPARLAVPVGVRSRSINAENPTGEPGAAARTASDLGPGRKGRPSITVRAGETAVLADVAGPGVIRHLWITVPDRTAGGPFVLRDLVLRMSWDGEATPSVEVPLGDFFCNGFATRALVTSEPIVVAPTGGMNSWFAMPFRERARIELRSEHPVDLDGVYFQIDLTTGDAIGDEVPTFHAQWRRSNATTALGEDHVILDGVEGRGWYAGTYLSLASLHRYWWGEGEVKWFVDGDTTHPSQTSTGLEDYAGGAWAFEEQVPGDPEPRVLTYSAPYAGYPYFSHTDRSKASPNSTHMLPEHGLYRWHLPDPIVFDERLRVTVQQIGGSNHGLFERIDDVSSVAYWYQTGAHAPFPPLPDAEARRPR